MVKFILVTVLLVCLVGVQGVYAQEFYDVIVKNGSIVDGTGKSAFKADIGIKDGKISFIGTINSVSAQKVIDVSGKIVAPGFIDIHTHSDVGIQTMPKAHNYILQGVTTIIGGNCGGSPADIETFLKSVEIKKPSINFGTLVGHGDIRKSAMQDATSAVSDADIVTMRNLVKKAMQDGAFGLSTGLEYVPGRYADTSELIELAKAVAEMRGIYTSHIRDEQVGVLNAVAEAIEVGAKSGAPVQISHIKACGAEVWGYGKTLSSMISMARSLGIDVYADQYPYTASSTGFSQAFPAWSLEGGNDRLKERLTDPELSAKIKAYAKNQISIRVGQDLSLIQIAYYKANPAYEGKRIADILKERGIDPTLDNGIDLIIEMYLAGDPSIIYHYINPDDIKVLMRNPFIMVASDGDIREFGKGSPHPRNYGTFPRVLGYYVRDQFVIPMEEAIRKMTSLPAQRLGLVDRGVIKPGNWADIVIFDANAIQDKADFFNPHQYPIGIEYVIVNGVVTAEHGKHTDAAAGAVLYGRGRY